MFNQWIAPPLFPVLFDGVVVVAQGVACRNCNIVQVVPLIYVKRRMHVRCAHAPTRQHEPKPNHHHHRHRYLHNCAWFFERDAVESTGLMPAEQQQQQPHAFETVVLPFLCVCVRCHSPPRPKGAKRRHSNHSHLRTTQQQRCAYCVQCAYRRPATNSQPNTLSLALRGCSCCACLCCTYIFCTCHSVRCFSTVNAVYYKYIYEYLNVLCKTTSRIYKLV